jgi:hypothetical protein
MVDGSQDIGFPLKILDNGLPNQRIGSPVDHFLYRDQFNHVGEMLVAGKVNRSHPAYSNDILDYITIDQYCSRN